MARLRIAPIEGGGMIGGIFRDQAFLMAEVINLKHVCAKDLDRALRRGQCRVIEEQGPESQDEPTPVPVAPAPPSERYKGKDESRSILRRR